MRNISKFVCKTCRILVYQRFSKTTSKICTQCQNKELGQVYKSAEQRNITAIIPDEVIQSKILTKEIRCQHKNAKRKSKLLSDFYKFYDGDSNYYPGVELNYKFSAQASADEIQELEKYLEERISNITQNLKDEFGSSYSVQFRESNGKKQYVFVCPECKKETKNLKRHLQSKVHSLSNNEATCEHSYRVRTFNYITKISQDLATVPTVRNTKTDLICTIVETILFLNCINNTIIIMSFRNTEINFIMEFNTQNTKMARASDLQLLR